MNESVMQMIKDLQVGNAITGDATESVFSAIMSGEATAAQIGAILMGLSIRGESAETLAGAAKAMRAAATRITPKASGLIDTCGTGGDGAKTFNISTAVSLVVAACGVPVAKHGNRAMSSKSGAADVLEALGVNLEITPEQVAACIDTTGIGFLFAQQLHPAMRHAGPVRRELGVRTLFNLLGPLTNPAAAEYQVLGVYAREKLDLVAGALQQLGIRRALVVHGRDGMDEITTTDITDAVLVQAGQEPINFEIDPAAFGMPYAAPSALAGDDAATNAAILQHIFAGQAGAGRDIVLLNAAAALWVAGKVDGIGDGLAMAARAIDSGKVQQTLNELIAFTRQANH
ncbi:MAG: anthranilate phosphoribosyltransferase [Zetaproteobacteria bacterium CG12_big_fil_rev_8_21_14_0_65_54_13]|nr:MAG: anthranilate phosphoribosyltransferase [Zetaproteobacteria bacterium CG23_combo_of_CG06-09_8_20_14_all_54_7]PIW50768.1 MAG: anthranilate phosphoribosyltransferase [Zetaproteobacteria bacterium CG12_big_fil_rev_8_21_14_0_65_54_13]PIX54215.1 MAG: anthranilate phosphoribosyltransferase [Zetaproteobacteria bacterium CG_4_10_14_3_um_filter_54_28]PJA29057.1 MAG: anthranilate phosphoribosyltransferase [Zetaproteobacteria bacterium CG_4_9_14_3_um_filter_54_145]